MYKNGKAKYEKKGTAFNSMYNITTYVWKISTSYELHFSALQTKIIYDFHYFTKIKE